MLKYLVFFEIFSKKRRRKICFYAYGQILKFFQAYLHKDKNWIFSRFKMQNGYHNQFMIIH